MYYVVTNKNFKTLKKTLEVCIMEMLINVQSNKIGQVVRETEKGKVLLIDGVEKEYAASTLKRWWKEYIAPVVEVVAETVAPQPVATTSNELPETVTETARVIIANAQRLGCTIKVTSSYIGLKFGKKTVMEIHCSKRGKTKLVVNSKSLEENLIASYIENGYAKLAPASYGWTLDFTIQADGLTTMSVLEVLDKGVNFRR